MVDPRKPDGLGGYVVPAALDCPRMPYFKDADEVYATIGKLFLDLSQDEELSPKFRKANTIVQYQYREPQSQITVRLLEGEDGQVDFGDSAMEPEVVMTMDADIAHRFWLGKVNVTVALTRGQMKAKGPVAKILKLVPLVKPVFPRYRKLLEDIGRQDLLEAS
jgi:putative sterol carrier protein